MAPNLVTFIGLLIVGSTAALLSYHDPDLKTTAPAYAYGIALLGHFLYQTFDAIDGKQARRTGTSSPLGQLFDHGCDAFITNIVGIFNASCMQYGSTSWTILNTMFNFNVFFLAQFEEYHTGELNTNNGFIGLTEGQVAQFFMLSVTLLGPASWQVPLASILPETLTTLPSLPTFLASYLDLEIRHAVLVPMGAVTFMLAIQGLVRVFFTVRQSKLKSKADRGLKDFDVFNALGQLAPQYIMYCCGYWITRTDHFQKAPLLLFMAWGVSCSFYTTQIIVAQMSKSPIDWIHALIFIAAPMFLTAAYLNRTFSVGDFDVEDPVAVSCWLIVLVSQYLYYVAGVCSDLSSHLGIKVFSI